MLYKAIGDIPNEYITEADEKEKPKRGVPRRVKPKWIAILAATLALLLILPTSLVIAHFNDPLVKYQNHPYAALLTSFYQGEKDAALIANLRKGNLFDRFVDIFDIFKAGASMDGTGDRPTSDSPIGGNLSAEKPDDVTDNQVEGVLEADVMKKSSTHVYYLWNNTLFIYTLDKENSRRVAEIPMVNAHQNSREAASYNNFYLVGERLILEGHYLSGNRGYTRLVALSQADLLDGKIDEIPAVATVEGGLLSTRISENSLLVMTSFVRYDEIDVAGENYLPHYRSGEDEVALSPDQITVPEAPSSIRCTALYLLDAATLAVKDSHALVGTPSAQYVSQNTVYLASNTTKLLSNEPIIYPYNEDRTCLMSKTVSYVEAIDYSDEGFTVLGGITIDGEIMDQYSLDEYQNVLRIAVTTREEIHVLNKRESKINGSVEETNASLYLVSLDDFQILSSANKFAPDNESVQSVRFDKELAYICTAEVITMTDPVYRFDLSDPTRITSLDTGTIDGYSTSLVELENGDLLGIGYGEGRQTFKLEIYRRVENSLISVATYEQNATEFSENYKSYYINREEGLFGIGLYVRWSEYDGVTVYDNDMRYYLFHYDGESLSVKETVSLGNHFYVDTTRGFAQDGYLYVVCPSNLYVSEIKGDLQ